MRGFRNLLKSVQNSTPQQFSGIHHQFRNQIQTPQYPIRLTNCKDAIDDMKNYYKILGVERCATYSEIKNAYYYLAKQYHPDNKGEKYKNQFNQIVEAYHILIDDNKRNEYDKYGEIKDLQGYMKRIGEREKSRSMKERIKLRDLLDGKKPIPPKGTHEKNHVLKTSERSNNKDFIQSINIDFMQSVLGLKKDFLLKCLKKCPKCRETYSQKSRSEKGDQRYINKICDSCEDNRFTQKNGCTMCQNKGYFYQKQPVHVEIPPGTSSGDILHVKNPNPEDVNKCITVRVNVTGSSKFERKGYDIHSTFTLSLPDAILGSKVKVSTIHGVVDVKIPPGSQSHSTITLYGKGIRAPKVNGNHILTLNVQIPKMINENFRKVLTEFNTEKEWTR